MKTIFNTATTLLLLLSNATVRATSGDSFNEHRLLLDDLKPCLDRLHASDEDHNSMLNYTEYVSFVRITAEESFDVPPGSSEFLADYQYVRDYTSRPQIIIVDYASDADQALDETKDIELRMISACYNTDTFIKDALPSLPKPGQRSGPTTASPTLSPTGYLRSSAPSSPPSTSPSGAPSTDQAKERDDNEITGGEIAALVIAASVAVLIATGVASAATTAPDAKE